VCSVTFSSTYSAVEARWETVARDDLEEGAKAVACCEAAAASNTTNENFMLVAVYS